MSDTYINADLRCRVIKRATVRMLQLNDIEYLEERLGLIQLGSYPCKPEAESTD